MPAFGERFKRDAQFLDCAKDGVLCSGGAGFERGGDFFYAAAIPMAHDDGGTFCRSEFLKRLFHAASELAAAGETLGRRSGVTDAREWIELGAVFGIARGLLASGVIGFALSEAVDGVVCGDAINPSAEVGLSSELFEFLVGAQKCLLHDFFRVMRIARHAISEAIDVLAVALDENAEGVAVTGKRAFHRDGVRDRIRGRAKLDARIHLFH